MILVHHSKDILNDEYLHKLQQHGIPTCGQAAGAIWKVEMARIRQLQQKRKPMGIFIILVFLLSACTGGPGAGVRWRNYPSLSSSPTSFRWLVVKCQLSDIANIPAGLDTNISQFFGLSGAGYGNMVDYFHDVSYNKASVIADNIIGWFKAPFSTADLASPNGRLASSASRAQRVTECLQAIPAGQLPSLEDYYGVIAINNAVNDGGACSTGQFTMNINNKNYNLACVWFDANSLAMEFAMHEIGHGLGLNHSYDDSGRICALYGGPGEYCDPWDIMSAQITHQFTDRNWVVNGSPSGSGPGLDAPGLLRMGWIPTANQARYDWEGDSEQTFTIRALSQPRGNQPLVVLLDTGSPNPFDGQYTIEYRQGDGWDRGFVSDSGSPASVRKSGGVVLVHQYRIAGAPASTLINGAFSGALQPCDTLVLTGPTGLRFHVTVISFDVKDGSALVSIGQGAGKRMVCAAQLLNPLQKLLKSLPMFQRFTRDHVEPGR